MSHKSLYSIFLFFFLGAALVFSLGCDVSDVNKQTSVTSGTTSGSGSSGGTPANVIVYAASNSLAGGATTSITVITTDASGKRTDASIILTSSMGGTFNGSNATLNGTTVGGIFIADYKAPSFTTDDEVTATVAGTILRGTVIIFVTA